MKTITIMKISMIAWLWPAVLVSAQTTTSPSNESPNLRLNQLISEQRYADAYALALDNRSAWEGDTEFDFLYGMAAIESGNPNEAVFAFERVSNDASTASMRARARLELARAYYLTNNMIAAETLFNQLLATDPPQNVRENIQAFLVVIDANKRTQQSSLNWAVSANAGYDNNINSSTAIGLVDTPSIGQIELNPDGLKTGDEYADLMLSMVYRNFISRDSTIDFNLNLNRHNNFSSSQFDLDTLRGDVAYSHGSGRQRFRYSLQGQHVRLAGTSFQQSAGISASWQRATDSGWYQSVSASLNTIRFDNASSANNDLRDVNQQLISLGLNKVSSSFTNSTNIYYADENSRQSMGEHNGRSYYGVTHSIQWRLNDAHMPYARVSLQELEHSDQHPVFFNTVRSDTTAIASIGWIWQLNRNLLLNTELSYTDSDSNIDLFSYSKTRSQTGFRYLF